MSSCAVSQIETKPNLDSEIIKSLPVFPKPSEDVVDELKDVCPENKCAALHDWIWRLMALEKQLALYDK